MTLLQLSRDGLRAITGGKAKEPVETAGQEPAETAEIHRIYPVAPAANPRLVELLKLVESCELTARTCAGTAMPGAALQSRRDAGSGGGHRPGLAPATNACDCVSRQAAP